MAVSGMDLQAQLDEVWPELDEDARHYLELVLEGIAVGWLPRGVLARLEADATRDQDLEDWLPLCIEAIERYRETVV